MTDRLPSAPRPAQGRGRFGRRTLISLLAVVSVAIIWALLAIGSSLAAEWWPAGAVWVPLGLFGLFRWIVWLSRKVPALLYRPITEPYRATTAIIVPVYQEDPEIFELALRSWVANMPDELILVIDRTDEACAAIGRRYAAGLRGARVLTIDVPGKRAALAMGIRAATAEIVVLVDSDTIWAPDTMEHILPAFSDPKIAGVGTRQRVWKPATLWQRIAQIYLDIRYDVEAPALTRIGRAVSCLSGRTAAYRRQVLLPLLPEFLNERFMGKLCVSGEDKRFTSLVLREGYDTYHQDRAVVWSTFPADFDTFRKQRIRWTRNTYRSDLRAMWDGWVWQRPYLAFMLVDRMVSPYALLIGVAYFSGAIISGSWLPAGALAAWWLVSRAVKISPHLRREPRDVLILPHYVAMTFVMAAVKAYSLATIHHHKWLTREVELVNGSVMRGKPQVKDRTPLATRLAGLALVGVFILIVQTVFFSLGGLGFARADTAPPVIEVIAPVRVTAGSGETLVVIAEDRSEDPLLYAWVIDGEPVAETAAVTLPATLPPGPHTWTVYVRDAAGNTATLSGRFDVATASAGATSVNGPGAVGIGSSAVLSLAGASAEAAASATWVLDAQDVATGPQLRTPTSLSLGPHPWRVETREPDGAVTTMAGILHVTPAHDAPQDELNRYANEHRSPTETWQDAYQRIFGVPYPERPS